MSLFDQIADSLNSLSTTEEKHKALEDFFSNPLISVISKKKGGNRCLLQKDESSKTLLHALLDHSETLIDVLQFKQGHNSPFVELINKANAEGDTIIHCLVKQICSNNQDLNCQPNKQLTNLIHFLFKEFSVEIDPYIKNDLGYGIGELFLSLQFRDIGPNELLLFKILLNNYAFVGAEGKLSEVFLVNQPQQILPAILVLNPKFSIHTKSPFTHFPILRTSEQLFQSELGNDETLFSHRLQQAKNNLTNSLKSITLQREIDRALEFSFAKLNFYKILQDSDHAQIGRSNLLQNLEGTIQKENLLTDLKDICDAINGLIKLLAYEKAHAKIINPLAVLVGGLGVTSTASAVGLITSSVYANAHTLFQPQNEYHYVPFEHGEPGNFYYTTRTFVDQVPPSSFKMIIFIILIAALSTAFIAGLGIILMALIKQWPLSPYVEDTNKLNPILNQPIKNALEKMINFIKDNEFYFLNNDADSLIDYLETPLHELGQKISLLTKIKTHLEIIMEQVTETCEDTSFPALKSFPRALFDMSDAVKTFLNAEEEEEEEDEEERERLLPI